MSSAAAPLRRSTRERRVPAHLASPPLSSSLASSPGGVGLHGGSSDGGDGAPPSRSGKASKAGQRKQQRAASHPYHYLPSAPAAACTAGTGGDGFNVSDSDATCGWEIEWSAKTASLSKTNHLCNTTLPTVMLPHDLSDECAYPLSEPLSPVSMTSFDESISTALSSGALLSRTTSTSSSLTFVDDRPRCPYPSHAAALHHHDHVLGRALYHHPSVDTTPTEALNRVYAMLCLAVLCTGLDLPAVLKKWRGLQAAFDEFDVAAVSAYGPADVERLQRNPKVMKDKVKINAIIQNAAAIQRMETAKPGSFLALLWSQHTSNADHADHLPEAERVLPLPSTAPSATVPLHSDSEVDFAAARTAVVVADGLNPSRAILRLKLLLSGAKLKRMGDAACLQFAQSVGLVNHHQHSCYAWQHCEDEYQQVRALRQGQPAMVAA